MTPLLWTVGAAALGLAAWGSVRYQRRGDGHTTDAHVNANDNVTTPSGPANSPVDRHVTAKGGRA